MYIHFNYKIMLLENGLLDTTFILKKHNKARYACVLNKSVFLE